jgi:hypothetical protein
MVQEWVGVPISSMTLPGGTYFVLQGEGMYVGSRYRQGPMHIPVGPQEVEFCRD